MLPNKAHHDGDLYMPLTAGEEDLFGAIDGQLSGAELSSSRELSMGEIEETLERAWVGDHIVFDVSLTNTRTTQ